MTRTHDHNSVATVPKFKYTARGLAGKGVLAKLEGFRDKKGDKVNFIISSDEVGVFFVGASNGGIMIPGASAQVLLDDLCRFVRLGHSRQTGMSG